MMPGNFWMPLPFKAIERVLVDTFEYRLHTIKIKPEGKAIVARIYDGPGLVFEAYGSDTEHALTEAKNWIDEQDEVAPVYNLEVTG